VSGLCRRVAVCPRGAGLRISGSERGLFESVERVSALESCHGSAGKAPGTAERAEEEEGKKGNREKQEKTQQDVTGHRV